MAATLCIISLPSFPPPKPYLVLRDTLCSCEAYGMRPTQKEKTPKLKRPFKACERHRLEANDGVATLSRFQTHPAIPSTNLSPTLPSFPPPKPYLVPRDTLCSCEAYGMRPMHKEFFLGIYTQKERQGDGDLQAPSIVCSCEAYGRTTYG